MAEEISRSRRLRLPVSFLIASIDNLDSFEKDRGREDSEFLIRSIANLLQKNSRTNDIVGRVGNFDFGLLLPHTNQQGATIKAERLRKLISSANFSETIYEAPKVTISVGVSEYPSLSSDAEELFESCDEALYQIKKVGPNKICLASVGEHFTPDFSVSEE